VESEGFGILKIIYSGGSERTDQLDFTRRFSLALIPVKNHPDRILAEHS